MNISRLLSRYIEFFASGDAVGKATEFMTRPDIRKNIGKIDGFVPEEKSQNHSNLRYYEVTDDTEQNLYLLRRYLSDGKVTVDNTVDALICWIDGTGAVEKKYIGPSSLRALNDIKKGKDPSTTGIFGTTCGGIMRVPSAVFSSLALGLSLDDAVYSALLPTHNNSVALESAYGYAYALRAALEGKGREEILSEAVRGCERGIVKAPWVSAAASLKSRLEFLVSADITSWSEDHLLDFLYGVFGTGLESYETAGAVFAIFMYTSDPVRAIFLSSSLGGDTDTIAALASSLIAMVNREAELPTSIIGEIRKHISLETGYEA